MDIPPSGPTAQPILATPIPGSIPTSVVPLDAAGRIIIDLPCKRCGYNLRTMMPDGRCPECATAVGQAMHGDYLKFADPAWVQKLASGINWIVVGTILAFILGAAATGIVFALNWRQDILIWLTTALGLITTYGYWRVTMPDPSGHGETNRINARQMTRVTILINFVINPPMQFVLRQFPAAGLFALPVLSLISLIGTVAMFRYARQLALRIPDTATAKGFRITMWGFVAMSIIGMLGGVLGMAFGHWASSGATNIYPTTATTSMTTTTGTALGGSYTSTTTFQASSGTTWGLGFVAAFGCVVGVSAFVFGIWAIILVLRLRKGLNQASEQALHSWAAIPVGQNR